jgi:hypothetical protein
MIKNKVIIVFLGVSRRFFDYLHRVEGEVQIRRGLCAALKEIPYEI